MPDFFSALRPLIHALPPEAAHQAGLWLLAHGLLPAAPVAPDPALAVEAFGLHFTNPIGLAAGFDKNAVAVDALLAQGFGFVEAGTVTPLPQPGNPRPRIFRLAEDAAVINRLGFNNDGLERFVTRFGQRDRAKGIAGANIGKNKTSEDAVADYVRGLNAVYPHADYVTINISSPNTQGLRDLQQRDALTQLLKALLEQRTALQALHARRVPLLLKIAPDLSMAEQEDIAAVALSQGIDGLIISNTTLARPDTLRNPHKPEQGGLSGKPLFAPSTAMLKNMYRLTQGKIPLIGVGGIASAKDAYAKIRNGATLVQLYTALVYQGFGMVPRMHAELAALSRHDGFSNVQDAIGIDAK